LRRHLTGHPALLVGFWWGERRGGHLGESVSLDVPGSIGRLWDHLRIAAGDLDPAPPGAALRILLNRTSALCGLTWGHFYSHHHTDARCIHHEYPAVTVARTV